MEIDLFQRSGNLTAMNAVDSDIHPWKKCINCDFRAEKNKDKWEKCCEKCGKDGVTCSIQHHDAHCSRLTKQDLARCYWECVKCDTTASEDAKCLVVPPSCGQGPRPVLLFLTGNGHVNDRQDFFSGGIDQLMRNNDLKGYWIMAPKPLSATGVMRKNEKWRWTWCEDGIWAMFTEILRRLGKDKVDPSRLYVTGLSLGASGSWHLALRYGQFLAGVAPVSGVCHWPHGAWPRSSSSPLPEVLRHLSNLPLRAYQIDADRYGGSPVNDLEWLLKEYPESATEARTLRGMEIDRRVEVSIRQWPRGDRPAWELWEAKGPLKDWAYYDGWGDGDKHCLWNRVYPWPEWGLEAFFRAHRLPQHQCWNVEEASPLSEVLQRQKEEEDAYNQKEAMAKMSTGDIEVMQEQKRLRQDEELDRGRPVAA